MPRQILPNSRLLGSFEEGGLAAARVVAAGPGILLKFKKALTFIKALKKSKAKSKATKINPHCFIAGTLVVMLGGELVPIEEIEPGDVVLTTSVRGTDIDHAVVPNSVASISSRVSPVVVCLTLAQADGPTEELCGTPNHPVFDFHSQLWRGLGSFRVGDFLQGDSGRVEVVARRVCSGEYPVFNLVVADAHTFRVGAAGVLVHNGDKYAFGGADPDIPIGKQLVGKGQLRNLRKNPNLRGVNIDDLLGKTPVELEKLRKQGGVTKKALKQIKKAFEGRDLGK